MTGVFLCLSYENIGNTDITSSLSDSDEYHHCDGVGQMCGSFAIVDNAALPHGFVRQTCAQSSLSVKGSRRVKYIIEI